MSATRAIGLALLLATGAGGGLSARPQAPFVNIPYATWSDDEPLYRLYPGDEIDLIVPSAPELNRTLSVGPDGRIMAPLVGPVMAADRTAVDLERTITAAYASQLLRPEVEVSVHAQPLKVFVGGDVGKPGIYDMPGDIDSLRAVVQAGGFMPTAKRSQVVIIRRTRNGGAMMRTVDLSRALHGDASDLVPLRRFDIVYVPKTGLGQLGDFMMSVKNALPVQFTYAFGNAAVFP